MKKMKLIKISVIDLFLVLIAFQAVMIYRAQGNGNSAFFISDAGETQITSQYIEDPLRKLYAIHDEHGNTTLESLIGSISALAQGGGTSLENTVYETDSNSAIETGEAVFVDYIVPLGNTVYEKDGYFAADTGEAVYIDYRVPTTTFSDSLLFQTDAVINSSSVPRLNGLGMLIGDVYGVNKECFE